jgi:hypothetical protein
MPATVESPSSAISAHAGNVNQMPIYGPGILRVPDVPLARTYTSAIARNVQQTTRSVRDSGHFCPYPRAYPARFSGGLQATSGRWKSCLATEDACFGEVLELSLGGAPRLMPKSAPRPHHQGIQAPNRRRCTNDPCVSAWRQGKTLLHEISYNYFDAVSLGGEIRAGGTCVRVGSMGSSKGVQPGSDGAVGRRGRRLGDWRSRVSRGSDSRLRPLAAERATSGRWAGLLGETRARLAGWIRQGRVR